MSATDLVRELRAHLQQPQRDPGYTAPSTGGQNQDDPIFDSSLGSSGIASDTAARSRGLRLGAGGAAQRDIPNDFEWLVQHRQELRGYTETMAVINAVNGQTVVLTANAATVYAVSVTGNVTIAPAAVADLVSENPDAPDAPTHRRVTSFVLMAALAPASRVIFGPSVVWSADYRSNPPVATTDKSRVDIYTLVWFPPIGKWIGNLTGTDYQ